MGAWIEIPLNAATSFPCTSLPSWERGLKLDQTIEKAYKEGSLPSWERGLKFGIIEQDHVIDVCRSPRGSVD